MSGQHLEPLTRLQREQLDDLLKRRQALEPPVLQSEAVLARQRELDAEIAKFVARRPT